MLNNDITDYVEDEYLSKSQNYTVAKQLLSVIETLPESETVNEAKEKMSVIVDRLQDEADVKRRDAFHGEGPIARLLRSHLLAREIIDGGLSEKDQAVLDSLDDWDIGPVSEVGFKEKLKAVMSPLNGLTSGLDTRLPSYGDITNPGELIGKQSGLYTLVAQGFRIPIVNISFTSNINPNVAYTIVDLGSSQLPYVVATHIRENTVTILDDEFCFKGIDEELAEQVALFIQDNRMDCVRNWDAEMEEFREKAAGIFKDREHLGFNLPDNQMSKILIESPAFLFRFDETRHNGVIGATAMITPNIQETTFMTRLYPSDIPEDQRETMFNAVRSQLNNILKVIADNKKPAGTIN